MHPDWSLRKRPMRLERRFHFPHYEATRAFLERTAQLSEQEGYYPDISFGRTYVNVTVYADEGTEDIGADRQRFAARMDDLLADAGVEASADSEGTSKVGASQI